MKNMSCGKWVCLITAAVLPMFGANAWGQNRISNALPTAASAETASPQAKAAVQQYMTGSSVFIENAGQWADTSIKFALDGMGANVGITDNGPRFQLFHREASPNDMTKPIGSAPGPRSLDPSPSSMHEFGLVFDGASTVSPVGRGKSDRIFNYLQGDVSTHRDRVGSFDALWYENLWQGVSLELTGKRTGLKYNFHVAPGTDPRSIRLRYDGIAGLSMRDDGALEIRVADGWQSLSDGKPYIYQEVGGENKTVAGRFILIDDHTYGFEVTGAYDTTLPLVIDPSIGWSTYLGGTDNDYGRGIAVDSSGNCYVTGDTASSGWVSGGYQTTLAGNADAFVVKLSSTGAHVWSTYFGGSDTECSYGIALDSSDNCYVTGQTYSSGWVSGGYQTTLAGTNDGFVVKLSSAGAHVWSTYLGGTSYEFAFGIALDSNDDCYVTGDTSSAAWTTGGWNTTYGGSGDGFVVKLSSAGTHLWSTYLGGTEDDLGLGIALDSSDNCYVTGSTSSSGWTSGGWNTTYGGSGDGFVAKLSSAGAHGWSTYLGGAGIDSGYAIALDINDNCHVAGHTYSTGWVSGGWNTTHGGSCDGFLVELRDTGAHVLSSYIGGSNDDQITGIAVDSSGTNVWVSGDTRSSGWVSGGWDTTYGGGSDGFVLKVVDLPAAPSSPGTTAVDVDTVTWTWIDNASNVTGFKVYVDPGSGDPTTLQTTTAANTTLWQQNNLTPNTQYAFQVAATNGSGDSSKTTAITKYTLAGAPSIGNNVACDRTAGTPCGRGTTFAFSNPAGFGAGTDGGSVYRATRFKYVWDMNATYTFSGAEADWSAGTIAQSPTDPGSYYLHVQSFNDESVANPTTLDYGPFLLDVTPPTPIITGATTLTNASRTLTIAFGEGMNGFTLEDIMAINATASNLQATANPGEYTVDILGSGKATVTLFIAAGVATDMAGNLSLAMALPFTYPFDSEARIPVITGDTALTNTTRTLTIAFGEAVTGFALPDGVTVLHGAVSNLQATANPGEYTVDILGSGANNVSVSIPAGVALDNATNPNNATAYPFTFPFDGVAPAANITLTDPSSTELYVARFTVHFTEPLAVPLSAGNVTLASGSLPGTIDVSGTNPDYSVAVTLASLDANGTVAITIPAAAVTDIAGNPIAATTSPPYSIQNSALPVAAAPALALLTSLLVVTGTRRMRKK